MSDVNPIAEPERAGRPLDAGTAKTSDDSSKPQGAYSFNDRSRPIWAAIRQDPQPQPPSLKIGFDKNEHHDFSPEEMVDNMAQRIQQAHSRIIGCCFAGRKRLTVMQDEQIRLDLGEPRWSPQHNGPREIKIPNGPPVINWFHDIGGYGLMWKTFIIPDRRHLFAVQTVQEWQEMCDAHLAYSLSAHFNAIEDDLAGLTILPDDEDGYHPTSLTWHDMAVTGNNRFLEIAKERTQSGLSIVVHTRCLPSAQPT